MPSAATPSRPGFTLVDLLIALTVLLVAAGVVVSSIGRTDDLKLRGAARILAADLEYAQVRSMSHGDDPTLVIFDSDGSGYRLAPASDPDTPLTNPVSKSPYRVSFGSGRAAHLAGVGIDEVNLDGDDRLGFGLYGQLDQTDPATITLRSGPRHLILTLDPVTGSPAIGQILP